jgi:hypothetical protein
MRGRWVFRLWIVVGLWGGTTWAIQAAPPWTDLISLKSVDADPKQTYPLTETNGPWMVMACSFSGDGAEQQSQELIHELRKKYKLPAYSYQGHFDPGAAQGRGIDEFGKERKWKYMKYKDSKDKEKARHPDLMEVAVLVGDYQAAEDADAQKTLQKIWYATPECLDIKDGRPTHQTLTGWRMIQRQVAEAMGAEKKQKGSMGHAFITTNPLLPPDYFVPKNGIDPLVLDMNKDAEFSLLDCPGKFTVQVATFKGQVIIKQDEIKEIEKGNKEMKSELAEAAEKAHHLAKALRMKGYEAYEFHDRFASIVTVGSFNSAGTPRADGRIEINPEIHKIMKTFGATSVTLPGEAAPVTPLKTLVGIPFDIQPIPVQVPKRTISTALRSPNVQ